MPILLEPDEIDRRLADLPGVVTGIAGTLVLAVDAPDFASAVRLVDAVGAAAEAMNHHPDIDVRWRTVTFMLSTHDAGGITQLDVELAHRILAEAARLRAAPRSAPERVEIALDCLDADALRPFWAAGLGYREKVGTSGGIELHDPAGRGPVLWFQPMDTSRPGAFVRGRFHLDVYVPDDVARTRVQACLDAGGRLVTDAHAPSWWVLADAEGNELCVCTRAPDPAGR